jgi:hypothetical protein
MGSPVDAAIHYVVGEAGRELFCAVGFRLDAAVGTDRLGVRRAADYPAGQRNIHPNPNYSSGVVATVKAELSNMMPAITQTIRAVIADSQQRGGSFS